MGPKNGHMTQEVLIRVFPGFTHAQRKKQFSFYRGCEAGKLHTAAGGLVEDTYLAEDEVRPALRGREGLVGSGRGRRGARRGKTWSRPPEDFAFRRALCLPSQPCAAWRLWPALQNPPKCEAGTGLSCLPGYRLWDTFGAQWIFIWSMRVDGWVREWLWEQKKKNHTEETLFPLYLTRRTVPS